MKKVVEYICKIGGDKWVHAFDEFRGGEVDYKDLAADFIGCLIGLLVTVF